MANDEVLESINSLNSKQRDIFDTVHNCAKKYAKHKRVDVNPVHIFLYGSGDTGKSYLVKATYNAVSKNLLFNCKEPKKTQSPFTRINRIKKIKVKGLKLNGLSGKAKAFSEINYQR